MGVKCFVHSCRYLAERSIEDFQVCILHDHPAVRRILEDLERPYSLWVNEGPAVMSAGPLEKWHFVPVEASDVISALECPMLARVPDGPNKLCHLDFDLTRPHS